jgi:ribose transport system permease protein
VSAPTRQDRPEGPGSRTDGVEATARRASRAGRLPDRRLLATSGIYVAFALLVLALLVLTPSFGTWENLANIGRQSVVLAVAATAMTFVIISGHIDLSLGAVAGAVGAVTALQLAAGTNPVLAVGTGLLVAVGFGVVNGLVVVVGKVPAFIATLATFYIAQGLSLSLTRGQTITFDAPGFRAVFATGSVLGVPASLWWLLAVLAVCGVLLHRSRFGADVFAIGGDARSALLLGLPVARRTFGVFVLAGSLMSVAAMVLVARIGNARSEAGVGLEFDAIAAVVIGGTSFAGGRGSLLRTAVGVLFIGVLNNGLALLDVDFYSQQAIKGVLVVAAVLLDRWARGGKA